ncbi:MAG: hypothetical protein WCB49_07520 [Gammaproteobacteria bacterium]
MSYVVRIYRHTTRRGDCPETLTGLVEDVNNNEHRAFHNMTELWDILRMPKTLRHASDGKAPSPSTHPAPNNGKRGHSS